MDVLRFIKLGLLKFGIVFSALYRDSLKGFIGSHGYRRNKNYWHLVVIRKTAIDALLRHLDPFILHADKKRALVRLRKNLIMRGIAP